MTPLDDLRAVAPPPPDPPPAPDLAKAPVGLPSDYEQLAREYGPGAFDGFLWLLVPGAANPNLDLAVQAGRQLGALQELGETLPYEPLLPFALTDNGDVVYWHLTDPQRPDAWPVVVNESRGPEWYAFAGGAAAFLAAVLSGAERPPMFPEDFPSADAGFEPA